MQKYPSIEQFRNVIKEVRFHHDYASIHSTPYPTITFTGTIKLHGTNAAVVKYKDRIEFQSRERVLSIQQDNNQFMLNMLNKDLNFLFDDIDFNDYVAVYGEWCGQGVQRGTAISQLPKMFVVFGCKVDGEWVYNPCFDNNQSVYNINQFKTYQVDIDFNSPEQVQNKLIELTNEVEAQCPVGKYFGIEGIGEGIVWHASYNYHFYQFKVKGEKHSVSKVKTLASVDIDKVNSILEFVENTVTENRLQQGITWLNENNKSTDVKYTGDFLRWVFNDIIKEEQDAIVANQIDVKKLGSAISAKARVWFMQQLA